MPTFWMFDGNGTKIMAMLALVIGLVASASIVGEAMSAMKKSDRYVTVRGVAEKEVKADLAVWPIRVRVTGNELGEANRTADGARTKVLEFLRVNGVPPDDVASQSQRVEDRQAKDYDQGKAVFRYLVEYTIQVRSKAVEKIKKVSEMTDKLAAAGVVLASRGEWDRNGPQFIFTQLNAVKPGMMSEATKSAREVAAQFAEDSDSHLGPIRRATQGLFTINDRDQTAQAGGGQSASDINKKVRVVVTLDYFITS